MFKMLYEPAIGQTLDEMRANFEKTDLYQHGDAKLVWMNQANLNMLDMLYRLYDQKNVDTLGFTPEDLDSLYEN